MATAEGRVSVVTIEHEVVQVVVAIESVVVEAVVATEQVVVTAGHVVGQAGIKVVGGRERSLGWGNPS